MKIKVALILIIIVFVVTAVCFGSFFYLTRQTTVETVFHSAMLVIFMTAFIVASVLVSKYIIRSYSEFKKLNETVREQNDRINLLLDAAPVEKKDIPDTAGVQEVGADGCSLYGSLMIDGMNVDRCIKNLAGDEGAFVQVLQAYFSDTRSHLSILEEQLEGGDLKGYAIVVHGIKGASYGICAGEVGDAAKILEAAAKAGDSETLESGHGPFAMITNTLLDNIGAALQEIDAAIVKPDAVSPDTELLEELRDACRNYEMDGADDAMSRLEAFKYESNTELVAWLREQIDNMAFETISGGEWPAVFTQDNGEVEVRL